MSSGTLMVSRGSIHVGYEVPKFPSLSSRLTGNIYETPYLYETWDIYRFTVYWFLIMSVGFHMGSAVLAAVMRRKPISGLWILLWYLFFGSLFGFMAGSICGIILAAIYTADQLHMSTWIPFTWSLLSMVFMVLTSYTPTSYIL